MKLGHTKATKLLLNRQLLTCLAVAAVPSRGAAAGACAGGDVTRLVRLTVTPFGTVLAKLLVLTH